MNEQIKQFQEQFGSQTKHITLFIARYRVILMALVVAAAIAGATWQSSQYLNPPRDEALYQSEVELISYSEIDRTIVDKLSKTQEDQDIQVESQFVPGRNDPFSE